MADTYHEATVITLGDLRAILKDMPDDTPIHTEDGAGNTDAVLMAWQSEGEDRFVSFTPEHS